MVPKTVGETRALPGEGSPWRVRSGRDRARAPGRTGPPPRGYTTKRPTPRRLSRRPHFPAPRGKGPRCSMAIGGGPASPTAPGDASKRASAGRSGRVPAVHDHVQDALVGQERAAAVGMVQSKSTDRRRGASRCTSGRPAPPASAALLKDADPFGGRGPSAWCPGGRIGGSRPSPTNGAPHGVGRAFSAGRPPPAAPPPANWRPGTPE